MAPQAVRRQLDLLHRAVTFRLLFGATLASGLGTWLAVIALTIDVKERTNSGAWVSALLIADFLPAVAIGLTLSSLVDRLSRKGLMVGADLVRFAVFCALPFAGNATTIVALAAVAGVATGFFRPAQWAGVPNLVAEEDLPTANSLVRTAEMATITVGTLLGGAVTAAAGPHLAYWLNAASFMISAALLVRISGRLLQVEVAVSHGHWRDVAEGLALIRGSRALLTVLVVWNLVMVSNALVNVSEVFLATVSFHAGRFGYGLLWAGSGLGLALGSVFGPSWLESRGIRVVYGGSIAVMAFGSVATALSPNVWVGVWCLVLAGTGNGAAVVYNYLLVQRGAPDQVRGRVLTVLMASTFAVLGLGMVGAGPLTDAVGPRWTWGIASGFAALAALVGFAMVPRERAEAKAEPLAV
jgi:MFS family permease